MDAVNLSVELAPKNKRGLRLRNPVMVASGTFGYGTEYAELVDIQRLGAIVSKGTTLEPRPGNPQPRLFETASGLLNSVGLENIGIEALVKKMAPVWAKWSLPVVVNIAGETVEEYARLSAALDGVVGVSAIEVNISCPNISCGGIEFGSNPDQAAEVTRAVRAQTSLPVIVKLTPNVTDIAEIAQAIAEAGADAISAINTVVGMAIDIKRRVPAMRNITGGLSGPAIKPIALYMVWRVFQAVGIPVVGIGGIRDAADALEFIMAGATAVQVGTASFTNPNAAIEVLEGIERFMVEEGVRDISELVGVAQLGR